MKATPPKMIESQQTIENELQANEAPLLSSQESLSTSLPLVRRVVTRSSLADSNLARRRSGALLMAAIAIASLFFRRLNYDLTGFMILELFLGVCIIGLLRWLSVRQEKRATTSKLESQPGIAPLVSLLLLMPWLIDLVSRSFGGGNGKEIQMLSSLAWGSLAAAVVASTSRSISISVICSGFLTLFATFISDSGQATWFAYAWGVLCLWWLVSNHWESVEYQAATQIQSVGKHRLLTLTVGCLVFCLVTALISDRVPVLRKLKAEIMPTSGGTTAKDSVGRGIGNGDALLAARNHPTSFGAVETDMFLESTKPSLFDLVSEEMGFPRLNRRVERAQGLTGDENKVKGGNFSEANKASGGSDFSTQREAPKSREKPSSIVGESIMFWAGSSSAHLAVERFNSFDGTVWTNGASQVDTQGQTQPKTTELKTPNSIDVVGQAWFYASQNSFPNEASPFVDALPESLKFTRFRSPTVPTRCGLQMWCVDLLDRADFFAVDSAGLVSMPGRENVPDYTVVRMINSRVDRERVEKLLHQQAPQSKSQPLPESCKYRISNFAQHWSAGLPRGLDQIEAVIDGLRGEFNYDRDWSAVDSPESTIPLEQFLEARRGPSYMFATAATQMLNCLGYETRLATGFYANSKHYLSAEREIGILPQDAHVWLELHLGGNHWIPLEPTPGFFGEPLSAGWWYSIKRARYAIATTIILIAIVGLGLVLMRGLLLEVICQSMLPLMSFASDRSRVVWLARLLDLRCRFAGTPRRKNLALRSHWNVSFDRLSAETKFQFDVYCRAADRICFGKARQLTEEERQAIRQLWKRLTYFQIRHTQRDNSKQSSTNPAISAT